MRIRVVHTPSAAPIDGIDLRRFAIGGIYDVGNAIAALMLAEGWAEPVDVPDQDDHEILDSPNPSNLMREIFPSYYEAPPALAFDRRKFRRKKP